MLSQASLAFQTTACMTATNSRIIYNRLYFVFLGQCVAPTLKKIGDGRSDDSEVIPYQDDKKMTRRKINMANLGIEPKTFEILAQRSNQLS